jgi:pimeloyl-ACP methyl ester carboxylesterase
MPLDKINGVNLYWELTGSSDCQPLVLVHGSWGDHHNWDRVVPALSQTFNVLTYDRRGHSKSERPNRRDTIEEDVSDLLALIDYLNLAPAHIAGNSGGAAVVLRTAAREPSVFKTLIVHEPPLFGLLKEVPQAASMLHDVNVRIEAVVSLIEKRENEQSARLFVETIAFGEGAWQELPPQVKETFTYNAPTFYDEVHDPDSLELDVSRLADFKKPALLTMGTQSAPFFSLVVEKLMNAIPQANRMTFDAGHVPHMTNPEKYVAAVKSFCLQDK